MSTSTSTSFNRNCDLWLPAYLQDGSDSVRITLVDTQPMTCFEKTHLAAQRAKQLAAGADPRVAVAVTAAPGAPEPNLVEIALKELDAGVFPPMSVIRYLPDGSHKRLAVQDMTVTQRRRKLW